MESFLALPLETKVLVIGGGLALIFLLIFIFSTIGMSRNKIMKKQIKVLRKVIDENEDDLEHISTKSAEISSKGVETTARAIKKGLTEEENKSLVFCKCCGKEIQEDSKFCRYCGKEQ